MFKINLQRFADDGAAEAQETTPEATQQGEQPADNTTQEPAGAVSFDDMLSQHPEYQEAFNSRMAEVQSQFDSYRQSVEPLLSNIADQYGIAKGQNGYDVPGIINAQAEAQDRAAAEERALTNGTTVEDELHNIQEARRIKRLEAENERYRRQEATQRGWEDVLRQEATVKQKFPGFDLQVELSKTNENGVSPIVALLNKGISLEQAYKLTNFDSLMQSAAANGAARITDSIRAGQSRPTEGAASGRGSVPAPRMDPAHLTREQREEIRKRVKFGDKVTFD